MSLFSMKWTIFVVFATSNMQGTTILHNQRNFKRISVSKATLQTAETIEILPAFNKISCLANTIGKNWSHLACYDKVCSLYDIELSSDHEEEEGTEDIIDKCYTSVPTVCIFGTQTFQLGQKGTHCGSTLTCTRNGWLSENCPLNYISLPENGCVSVVQESKNLTDSENYCGSQGARLYVPGNFTALRQYMKCAHPEGLDILVGIYDRKWDNGQEVLDTEWDEGEPSSIYGNCAHMGSLEFRLNDIFCTRNRFFMCQIFIE